MEDSGLLILVRHGQSEWNQKNLFTGWKDPDLTKKGIEEANKAGILLSSLNFKFDLMFTSDLKRAQNTGKIILNHMQQEDLRTIKNKALNERDYGDLSGLNKDEARQKWGDDQVYRWRRSFDEPPPGGESLKDTAERVLPFYNQNILPHILNQKNILIAAHGNSLRALLMNLRSLSPSEILKVEIATGEPIAFAVKGQGQISEIYLS